MYDIRDTIRDTDDEDEHGEPEAEADLDEEGEAQAQPGDDDYVYHDPDEIEPRFEYNAKGRRVPIGASHRRRQPRRQHQRR